MSAPSQGEVLDLRDTSIEQLDWLRNRVARDGFCVVPGQQLGPGDLDDLAIRSGAPMFTPGEVPLPSHRFVFEVTNRNRTTVPRSVFHSDTSYVDHPPAVTALAAVEIPASGGETIVIDQYEAVARAPSRLLQELDGVQILHVASRVTNPDLAGSGAWHDALLRHPISGRVSFYLTARERLAGVRRHGRRLEADAASDLLDRLHHQATEVVEPSRHRWRAGDVLFIDNRCTLHAADHSGVDGPRTLHRVMFGDS